MQKYSKLHTKLAAFLIMLDLELGKAASPMAIGIRHADIQPLHFDVITKQGSDLGELNKQRGDLGMSKLPKHANIPELPSDARIEDHTAPCTAAKVYVMKLAGRDMVETSQVKGWDKILADALAAHPEVTNPSPLYFRLAPAKTSVKATNKPDENAHG